MFLRLIIRSPLNYRQCNFRAFSTAGPSKTRKSPSTSSSSSQPAIQDVPGLTSRCVKQKSQPLGPGASTTGEYKVPEYYCYDKTSYHEAEIEMLRFRCPQPSAQRKD